MPVSGRSSAEGPDHSSSVGQRSLFDRMERQNGLISFLFFPPKNFTALIPGTTVEILHGDSKNILQLIINAYNVSHRFLLPPSPPPPPSPPEALGAGADSGRKGTIVLGYLVLCLFSCLLSLAPSSFIWIRGREGILPVRWSPLTPATLTHIVSGSQ